MFKLLLSTLLLCTFLFADTKEEKTYIFKAKGEFAEELKALMEKHAQKGDVQIQEVKKTRTFGQKATSIVDSFLNNEELSGDIAYGKHLYEKTCYRCHGKKADESTYSTARDLNTLTKKELYENLRSYKTDSDFGKSTRLIMHEQVSGMTAEEMVSVSAYIYSLHHSTDEAKKSMGTQKTDENEEPVQDTYLK